MTSSLQRALGLGKPSKRSPKPAKRIASGKAPNPMSKKNLPKLKRKLWKLFSDYIKDRDGNTCFSCGRGGIEGSGWHAGHMFPSGDHAIVRYHPKNVHSQCFHCNINLGGNGAAYTERFLDVYGIEEFRRMCAIKSRERQWQPVEIMELIEALKRGGADFECFYEERYGVGAVVLGIQPGVGSGKEAKA